MNEMRKFINLVEGKKLRIYDMLRWITDEYNTEMNPKDRAGYKGPGFRVWTRMDGIRHRDPAFIYFGYNIGADPFWEWLTARPGVRPAGTVSGEWGSSSFDEAVRYKGYIWVNRGNTVDVMSTSRVRNPRSVWRQRTED